MSAASGSPCGLWAEKGAGGASRSRRRLERHSELAIEPRLFRRPSARPDRRFHGKPQFAHHHGPPGVQWAVNDRFSKIAMATG